MSNHYGPRETPRPTVERPFRKGGFSSHNLGALLAILAGLFIIGSNIWPAAPFVGEEANPPPWYVAIIIGAAYLASPFVAQRSAALGRVMLAAAAVGLFAWGALALGLWGTSVPLASWLVIVGPTVAGLAAATMIGRMEPDKAP